MLFITQPPSPISTTCRDNTISSAETCGGTDAFDLYKLEWPEAPVDDPEYMECYADVKTDRIMDQMVSTCDMTPAVCRKHCMDKNAMYYGTQVNVYLF